MKSAVAHGCVPVVIQDGIRVEWEEQLPMQRYAVRLPSYAMHKMHHILDAYVDTGRWAQMQRAMQCVWRFHWWRHPAGRAFELVMCELRKRLVGGKIHLDTDSCTIHCGGDGAGQGASVLQEYFVI
mmetsp:Transcript_18497/g.46865  ORF Transcript_18497/g.46865 Transcript_18497/m.46865 type:complete len:126 (-) Transcript_18497:797-1174(-)